MRKIVFGIILITCFEGSAQEVIELTLEDCIEVAMDRNIDLQRAKNNEMIARANRFQSIMNFFPTLSAGINYDYFFGNFFDQNAARQVSETSNSSNPNISSSVVIFNGMSNQYNLKQRISEQRSASAGVENAELNVRTGVLVSYLNAVLSKESLKIVEARVKLLESQLDREEKRVSIGVGNLDAVYNLRSDLSNEKQNLVSARNDVASSRLTLLQAMRLNPQDNYDVNPTEILEEDLLTEIDQFDIVLAESLVRTPPSNEQMLTERLLNFSLKEHLAGCCLLYLHLDVLALIILPMGLEIPKQGLLSQTRHLRISLNLTNLST